MGCLGGPWADVVPWTCCRWAVLTLPPLFAAYLLARSWALLMLSSQSSKLSFLGKHNLFSYMFVAIAWSLLPNMLIVMIVGSLLIAPAFWPVIAGVMLTFVLFLYHLADSTRLSLT